MPVVFVVFHCAFGEQDLFVVHDYVVVELFHYSLYVLLNYLIILHVHLFRELIPNCRISLVKIFTFRSLFHVLTMNNSLFIDFMRVKESLLTFKSVLVEEHFLILVFYSSQLLNINLHVLLILLKSSQDRKSRPNPNLTLIQQSFQLLHLPPGLILIIPCVVILPQSASNNTCGIVDTDEVFGVFLYVENYSASYLDFLNEEGVSENEESLR